MILKFKKLQLNNFMSFGQNVEIDLQRNGYTLVKGINENPDDNAVSNGSGKSSIWEAIAWCLTGETIRGSKEVKNLYCDGTTSVTLYFNVDEVTYEITRTKNPSNLTVVINGEDKSSKGIRDTETLLKTLLPDLTSSLLGSVIILGQGLPQRFTNNTPSGRKEVLEKLSKSDFMIGDLKDRITSRLSFIKSEIDKLNDCNIGLNAKKEVLNQNLTSYQLELDTFKEDVKTSLQEQLDSNKNLQSEILKDVNNLNIEITDTEKSISTNQQTMFNLSTNVENLKNEVDKEYYGILESKNFILDDINKQIIALSNEINKLDSIVDICPTCGQKLTNVVKPDTTNKKQELQQLKESYNKVSDEYDSIVTERDTKKNEVVSNVSSQQLKLTEDTKVLQAIKVSLQQKLNEQNNELNNINIIVSQLDMKLSSFEEQYKNLISKVETVKKQIEEIDSKVLYNNTELETWNSHCSVVTKMNSIVTRDFRGYLLTNVINFINEKAKEYSQDVFETDKIEFKLEGNNISISYDDKEYENLSGGEKQKVDIIVQFAIRDMLCKFLNFSSNILVLDEIFDNLDSIGCSKVLNLIATKLSDVDSIYIVTHHSDISIPYDDELIIVKGANKISSVK